MGESPLFFLERVMDFLQVELKILEAEQKIVLVCSETGRQIGIQCSTVITSTSNNITEAKVVFQILPKKGK